MQGNWVGQSEMMLAGPVIEERTVGIICGWMWAGMMDWEVSGLEWPGFLGAGKPAVVNCYDI